MATRTSSISGLSEYVLVPLREGGDFILYRGNMATHRQSWQSPLLQNSRLLRSSGGSSTNTRSQPNSIPLGRLGHWRSLVAKGRRFSY